MDFRLRGQFKIVVCFILIGLNLGKIPKAIANPINDIPQLETWEFDPQRQQLRLQTTATAIPQ